MKNRLSIVLILLLTLLVFSSCASLKGIGISVEGQNAVIDLVAYEAGYEVGKELTKSEQAYVISKCVEIVTNDGDLTPLFLDLTKTGLKKFKESGNEREKRLANLIERVLITMKISINTPSIDNELIRLTLTSFREGVESAHQ